VKNGVTVHGAPGPQLPVLHGFVQVNAHPFLEVQSGGTLRDVELTSSVREDPMILYNYTLQIDPTALIERVIARATGVSGVSMTACTMLGGTVLDSACLGSGPGSVTAVGANSNADAVYTLRNVTAITTAIGGYGVSFGTFNKNVSLTARNLIARGPYNALHIVANDPAGVATMTVDHSNWDTLDSTGGGSHTLVAGPGNQNGATGVTPLFVDPDAGDFREAPGSPTIDTGGDDPANGTLALDGQNRTIGPHTDIGAYETQFVPSGGGTGGPGAGGGGGAGGSAADRLAPRTKIGRLKLSRRGVVSTTLTCPVGEVRCSWAYTLRSTRKLHTAKRSKSRRVKLGSGHASAAGGAHRTIRIKLSKKNLRLIRNHHGLSATLVVGATDAAGNKANAKRSGKLKIRRR
jgi:hypothetical protein